MYIVLMWSVCALVFLIEVGATFLRYMSLEKPLRNVYPDAYDIVPFYNAVHRRYKAYVMLPDETFRNIKLGLRSMSKVSPFEKTIDVFAKILFTVGLAVMTLVTTMTAALVAIFQNDELKEDKDQWLDQIISFIDTYQKFIDSFTVLINLAGAITAVAIIHYALMHMRNNLLNDHLVIIDEIELDRFNQSHPFAVQYPVQSTSANRQLSVSQFVRPESHEPNER